ncbi:7265_t:CDS:1, partial [Gigaspora margarita]
ASELATLSLNDFREENGLLWISINRSKTDQQGVEKFIPIELTNSRFCPIRLWKQYLRVRGNSGKIAFLSNKNGKLTVGAISSIIKRIANHAGLKGRYTSHSLRIGRATAAMKAGLSLPQIMAIG